MVAFSPEIIWRESLSFSCSISMVFQDDFSRVLKGASSSWPSCASIVPRKSAPRQPRLTEGPLRRKSKPSAEHLIRCVALEIVKR